MNRKSQYKDLQKWFETCKRYKRRYYDKTAIYPPSAWTTEQDKLVLEHSMTDHELSDKIGHSVRAIQIRRHRLKYGGGIV